MNWKKEDWFGDWFNSPYYHILYKNRDATEAQDFINTLVSHLHIQQEDKLLDIACGKGRHAIYLNELGFDVEGIDLSEKNIEEAKQSENERLHFAIHDMREVYKKEHFDFAFNMFTSFGYFNEESDNLRAIQAIGDNIKAEGVFVMDFLNPYKVINHLVEEEIKEVEGIEFHINRSFDGEHIIKDIQFDDEGKHYQFQEKVKAIRRIEFLDYFRQSNLLIQNIFGDYNLKEYQAESSDRMIFICKKL